MNDWNSEMCRPVARMPAPMNPGFDPSCRPELLLSGSLAVIRLDRPAARTTLNHDCKVTGNHRREARACSSIQKFRVWVGL
jgi:hypothetical protein